MTPASQSDRPASAQALADCPGNCWRDLAPPDAEAAAPTVSVILVGDRDGRPERDAGLGAEVEVISAEDRTPQGEVVLVVDAAVAASPGLVAAHAAWHGTYADLVTVGPVHRGNGDDQAFELIHDLTRGFEVPGHGLHLGAAGVASIGVRRETFEAVGGIAEAPAGLQRLDLAYRLTCFGAVFVPVAEPGVGGDGLAGTRLAAAAAAAAVDGTTLELADPAAASIVPLPPFRAIASPRRHRRPSLVVNVDAGGAEAGAVLATLRPVLGGRMGDLELRVQGADDHPGRAEIERAVGSDPRARFAPSSLEGFCDVPFQVVVPPQANPDPRTIADLHVLAIEQEAGALHVTVPGSPPQDVMIEVVATGAWERARRLAAAGGEPVEAIIGRLFGERWVSGVEVSVRAHGVDEPSVTEHGPLAAATNLKHERINHLRFRDRADHLQRVTQTLARRTMSERLRAREQRRRADRLERRLAGTDGAPRLWRLRPIRSWLARRRERRGG